ncbi:hypothetical protein EZV62_013226 [Acer yangbiense]|uniref:Uncharacterized protein n=1 Tax=Acer yangbiense TaxID=1000413 RepID=A0A5C7HXK3_9ROSI|nr:hypothetical protein EZV62_013226 [Acer yangbiense]
MAVQPYKQMVKSMKTAEWIYTLLTNGVFIVEFIKGRRLQRYREYGRPRNADPIWSHPSLTEEVFIDMLKLENQLPFLVISKLADEWFKPQVWMDGEKHENNRMDLYAFDRWCIHSGTYKGQKTSAIWVIWETIESRSGLVISEPEEVFIDMLKLKNKLPFLVISTLANEWFEPQGRRLQRYREYGRPRNADPIWSHPSLTEEVFIDMLNLENQLPFLVISTLVDEWFEPQTHKDFTETRVVCDLTIDDLSKHISTSSVDIVTMRAFYFSNDFLTSLFKEKGFDVEELDLCCKQIENRSRELVMNRRWVQAVFRVTDGLNSSSCNEASVKVDLFGQESAKPEAAENALEESVKNFELGLYESMASEMYGISSPEGNEVNPRGCSLKIRVLSKEYQHTCKSTGLMLWESARLIADVLARNPTIVAGKRMLELGCGCGGICSMVVARSADLMVATEGDPKALELLNRNVTSNLNPPFVDKLVRKRLEWGNRDHMEVILWMDVTYVPEAILPLFATAKELISSSNNDI